MFVMTITTIAFLLFLLAVLVGAILLQIFLSRRKSRWPGWCCRRSPFYIPCSRFFLWRPRRRPRPFPLPAPL